MNNTQAWMLQFFWVCDLKRSLRTTIRQKIRVRNIVIYLLAFAMRTVVREIFVRWWTHVSHLL